MVRNSVLILILFALTALPALAQSEDFPRIETSFGYANTSLNAGGLLPGKHSGFSNISGLNLFRSFGIENYMGYYGMGGGVSMFMDTFGGRLTARNLGKIVPYAGAGIGAGYLSSGGSYSGSNFATRVNVGVDIPVNDAFGLKFDVGRISMKAGFIPGQNWTSGVNVVTGVVLNLGQ